MRGISLSPRLFAATELLLRGETVWDTGTDHCYIPIYLLERGLAKRVIASDINLGPLEKAKKNLAQRGFTDKITLLCEDGLSSADIYRPDEILICGMGGEVIADIIDRCEYIKSAKPHLILQPMTKAELLRIYLASSGFEIIEEKIISDGKPYELISCRYDGSKRDISSAQALFGEYNLKNPTPELFELMERRKKHLCGRAEGIKSSGGNAEEETELLDFIDGYISENKHG